MPAPSLLLAVAAGSALGATARFALALLLGAGPGFPWATFAANGLGCLAIGGYAGLASAGRGAGPGGGAFVSTGFCGGFTTLSVFSLEAVRLLPVAPVQAGLFVVGSAALWLAAVAAGERAGRRLAAARGVRRP